MLVLIPLQSQALITVCLWIKAPGLLLGVKPLQQSLAMPMWPLETHAGFWHTASSPCTTVTGDSYGAGCWPCQGETASTAGAAPFGHHPQLWGIACQRHLGQPLSWCHGSAAQGGPEGVCSPGALGSALLRQRAWSGSLRGHTATPSTRLSPRGVQRCCHGDPQQEPSPCACWTTLCQELAHPAPRLDTGNSPDNTLLHTINTLPKQHVSVLPGTAQGWHQDGAAA